MIVLGIETSCDETSVSIVEKEKKITLVRFYRKGHYLKLVNIKDLVE